MKQAWVLALLIAGSVSAAEPKVVTLEEGDPPSNGISIIAPTTPLTTGKIVKLPVTGVAEDELVKLSADVNPSVGVFIDLILSLDRKPSLLFQAEHAGTYNVNVIVNRAHVRWKDELGYALTSASLADIDKGMLAELQSLIDKAAETYPTKTALQVLSVSGVGPRPPPDIPPDPPKPPPVPTAGIVYVIVIRTTDTMTADQSKILSDLRQWTDEQPNKVTHLEFPPDAVGPNGQRDPKVATWVALVPPAANQPYVFVAQKSTTTGKIAIRWQGELTASAAEIIKKVQELNP